MSWLGKNLGQIAEEMAQIETLPGAINYKRSAIENFGGEQQINISSNMSADDWFLDYVRFIEERYTLPRVWGAMLDLNESHNATPTQHETATNAENHNETDR